MNQSKTSNNKRLNPWKWAFWLLLLAITSVIIGFYLFIQTSTREETATPSSNTTTNVADDVITAEADLSTMSFNQLVTAVIGGDNVPYQLTVGDQVSFSGTLDALGTEVVYTMEGQPSVMEDGNIAIDVTNIVLAGL